jgi:hypothetical protein
MIKVLLGVLFITIGFYSSYATGNIIYAENGVGIVSMWSQFFTSIVCAGTGGYLIERYVTTH